MARPSPADLPRPGPHHSADLMTIWAYEILPSPERNGTAIIKHRRPIPYGGSAWKTRLQFA
ncbi:hypothetical protein FCH28_04470 [Streptomyces piniterrae]|uniref:Uncharacterized protein n=1 Tax=Streptomyces piniterrae TaxID=2571125 RepID=A0A4U0NQF0_9ACTN|nr:hypothetical protein [Streptomyces piniterrae]TJZ56791.1 hypothetical protein FCH28_04470 [Streptomyces piniterrae]